MEVGKTTNRGSASKIVAAPKRPLAWSMISMFEVMCEVLLFVRNLSVREHVAIFLRLVFAAAPLHSIYNI